MSRFKSIITLSLTLALGVSCMFSQGNNSIEFKESQAKMKIAQAEQYVKDYRYSKALSKFDEAISLNDLAIYHVKRAKVYLEIGKEKKAEIDYRQALKIDKHTGLAYLGVVNCMLNQKDSNDSLQWYMDQALFHCNKNSEQAIALHTVTKIKIAEGDYKGADNFISAAYKLDPDNAEIGVTYALVFFELDSMDVAIEVSEKILAKNKKGIEYMVNLGYLYNSAERYDDASKVLNRALSYEPDNLYVLANLGYTLFMKNNLDKAKKAIDKSIKNDPTNAYGYYVRGLIALEGKDVPKACKCFNKSMDRSTFNKDRSVKVIKKALVKNCNAEGKI